jgi:uncharacterized protein (TIGR02452 family)
MAVRPRLARVTVEAAPPAPPRSVVVTGISGRARQFRVYRIINGQKRYLDASSPETQRQAQRAHDIAMHVLGQEGQSIDDLERFEVHTKKGPGDAPPTHKYHYQTSSSGGLKEADMSAPEKQAKLVELGVPALLDEMHSAWQTQLGNMTEDQRREFQQLRRATTPRALEDRTVAGSPPATRSRRAPRAAMPRKTRARHPIPGLTGLHNRGNNCYLISALQYILASPRLTLYLCRKHPEFQEFVRRYKLDAREGFSFTDYDLEDLKDVLIAEGWRELAGDPDGQHDSPEALEKFLEKIEVDSEFGSTDTFTRYIRSSDGSELPIQGALDASRALLKLPIPTSSRSKLTLLSMFDQATCKREVSGDDKIRLGDGTEHSVVAVERGIGDPPTLHISPIRYKFNRETGKRTKIATPIHSHLRILRGADTPFYNLTSFIVHSGRAGGGHYTSYVKKGERWYQCNDGKVKEIDPTSDEFQRDLDQAYSLQYLRQDIYDARAADEVALEAHLATLPATAPVRACAPGREAAPVPGGAPSRTPPRGRTRATRAEIAAATQARVACYADTVARTRTLEGATRPGYLAATQFADVYSYHSGSRDCVCAKSHRRPSGSELRLPALKKGRRKAHIEVIGSDTLDAAHEELRKGKAPLVLNMACFGHPGGGVTGGSRAQEERLCRTTSLMSSLTRAPKINKGYALRARSTSDKRMIYSPSVVDFKAHDEPTFTPRATPSKPFSVVSVAGIQLRSGERINPFDLKRIYKQKIRDIIRLAQARRHDSIIWGALGCGAYAGGHSEVPGIVAEAFKEVLAEVGDGGGIRHIFAIIDDHNGSGNLATFKGVLTPRA